MIAAVSKRCLFAFLRQTPARIPPTHWISFKHLLARLFVSDTLLCGSLHQKYKRQHKGLRVYRNSYDHRSKRRNFCRNRNSFCKCCTKERQITGLKRDHEKKSTPQSKLNIILLMQAGFYCFIILPGIEVCIEACSSTGTVMLLFATLLLCEKT